jgi:uncharacterized protein (TIGR00106 family)
MLLEFSTFPIGSGESLSKDVAGVIDIIEKSGLVHKTHAMGTVVEGEWDDLMELVKRCHFALAANHNRVETRIVIDDRKGASGRIKGKIDSIERHLDREIEK